MSMTKAPGAYTPLLKEEEQRGRELIAKALGLSHISCEGCLRAACEQQIGQGTEMYGYQDDQHNTYWLWMISRARRIAKRDAIPAEPIPWELLRAAAHQAQNAAIPGHMQHIPLERLREPVLVAMLPVQPFGASMIIDGNHRLLWALTNGQVPMMQLLDQVQSVEALVTAQDQEEAIRTSERIIRIAQGKGISL